jgi:predicted DNA-binding antitoxin AbrB/MazE fold protein
MFIVKCNQFDKKLKRWLKMHKIKGIYENGLIKPSKKINIKGRREVIIIFLESSNNKKNKFLKSAGTWRDIDVIYTS